MKLKAIFTTILFISSVSLIQVWSKDILAKSALLSAYES